MSRSRAEAGPDAPGSRRLALLARALTLFRIVGLVPFALGLVHVDGAPTSAGRAALASAFVLLAASDFADGRVARRAGAPSARWGRIDVAADVLLNFASLSAAAWLGLVGPHVPAIVAVLGLRFAFRILRATGAPLPEDRAGKTAGVLFYVLTGAAVGCVTLGLPPPVWLSAAGDAVFLYGLGVLLLAGRPGPS